MDGKFIQKTDPIYLDPVNSNFGRAHFYAPRKKFMGNFYETFGFNLCIIWLMSLIMGITLYFDVLKKFINLLEAVFSKFGKTRE